MRQKKHLKKNSISQLENQETKDKIIDFFKVNLRKNNFEKISDWLDKFGLYVKDKVLCLDDYKIFKWTIANNHLDGFKFMAENLSRQSLLYLLYHDEGFIFKMFIKMQKAVTNINEFKEDECLNIFSLFLNTDKDYFSEILLKKSLPDLVKSCFNRALSIVDECNKENQDLNNNSSEKSKNIKFINIKDNDNWTKKITSENDVKKSISLG